VSTDSGDNFNTSVGIYTTKWTGDGGFFLNEQHVKIRGFCNHESFGGVGMVRELDLLQVCCGVLS
jgi:beta-galactosidase/beta-glucuronidase